MPVYTRFTNFFYYYDFRKAVATALLGISKVLTLNYEIHSFYCCSFKVFVFLCSQKSNLGYKLKDFSSYIYADVIIKSEM